MEYEFYIDQFFFTTLFYNFLSLYLSSTFLRKKRKYWRLFLASAIGGAWNCLVVVMPVCPLFAELLATLCVISMVIIPMAFGTQKGKEKMYACWVLVVVTMIISGSMIFCRQFLWLEENGGLMLTGIVSLTIEHLVKYMVKTPKLGTERYAVRLFYRGREKDFLALADSGNRLKVPETGKAVAVISKKDCAGFCDRISGGFYIPYRSVGTGHGLLFAVTFEKMEIEKDGEWVCIERPTVAITTEVLSSDQSFSMILPEEYVR